MKKVYSVKKFFGDIRDIGNYPEYFTNLKKAYQFYLISVPKHEQVSYSKIANRIAESGVFKVYNIIISKIDVK